MNRFKSSPCSPAPRGFTLIEVMITVAIIGILGAIALPQYSNYVIRSSVQEAVQGLAAGRVKTEQYFLDNRTYLGGTATDCGTGFGTGKTIESSAAGTKFTLTCSNVTATTYTITATGDTGSSVSGFVYTINQDNVMTSTISKTGWPASCTSSWAVRPGGC